ncbi:hypothetical protein Syun_018312 [Stephania yunnanensis]|uniref:Disease resistance R13L4/SHOC-2-like LRR domain-containing protein n=1 Tax=Stephania yunnanensis TaxID=152371 RepID=A0AAP0ISP0_9MAGN
MVSAAAGAPHEENPSPELLQAVSTIMRLYRSLPPRPTIEEVEAAKSVLTTVTAEEQARLDEISREVRPDGVPEELFTVLVQAKQAVVVFQCDEQRRQASWVVKVDGVYGRFDQLIQRASLLVSSGDSHQGIDQIDQIVDEAEVEKSVVLLSSSKSLKGTSNLGVLLRVGEEQDEKLSLMKVAGLIETSAKTGAGVLDLKGKLMDQIEWLPTSLGKLTDVTALDISENRIMALPTTIGSLKALTKLDAHSNQIINLPDAIGELVNLTDLDLHANRLKSLPASFGNLTNLINLDLSSNQFTLLPDTLGNLTCLKRLNVETNEIEELPYTIGSCSSLIELRLDFNQLKALPEAIGKLENLEILTLHYNRIRGLPTTIGNLSKLKELDVSFNELEHIPENLGFVTSLVKLNVGRNFADLTALPRSIGNLEMLEELDISNNQIKYLPESFRLLSKLRVLYADENPLEVPPREVIKLGAQGVVQYMADLVAMQDVRTSPSKTKKKGFWSWFCSLCWPKALKTSTSIDPSLNAQL